MSSSRLELPDLEDFLCTLSIDQSYLRRKFLITTPEARHQRTAQFAVWVDEIQTQQPQLDSHQVSQECEKSIQQGGAKNDQPSLQTWAFRDSSPCPAAKSKVYLLVLEANSLATADEEPASNITPPPWKLKDLLSSSFTYERLNTDTDMAPIDAQRRTSRHHRQRILILVTVLAALAALFFAAAVITLPGTPNKWPEDGYVKYPTPGSEGPKREIYYHNATEWSQQNPHNRGEWKIRLDDQVLVPSGAWDDDEDQYQQWFHTRYTEMHQVIETKKYIRPSWLGSLDIIVPWDREFHMAHCVVTLRRYWKAKETGRHVCPRDIAY